MNLNRPTEDFKSLLHHCDYGEIATIEIQYIRPEEAAFTERPY